MGSNNTKKFFCGPNSFYMAVYIAVYIEVHVES